MDGNAWPPNPRRFPQKAAQTEPSLDTLTVVPPIPATVYLSLGSNLGDRQKNLRDAIAALPTAGLHVARVSSFYETEPVDYLDQPWFLNCVVEGQTGAEPLALLHALRAIESRLGSQKEF